MADAAAQLTREQIIEVMQACGITDFSEDAIQQCVADALAIRNSGLADAVVDEQPSRDSTAAPPPAVAETRRPDAAGTGRIRSTRADLRGAADDELDYDMYEVRRTSAQHHHQQHVVAQQQHYHHAQQQQPATARATDVSPFSNEPAPPAPQSSRRAKQVQAHTHHHQHQHRHTTRSHQHRFERTSISSVRGTPVVGRPGIATPMTRGGAYIDPNAIGRQPSQRASPAQRSLPVSTGGQQRAGTAGRRPQSASAARRVIPGYMSAEYAEHLIRQAAGEAEATAEATAAADDEAGAAERDPRHQRRFEPFVSASTRARQMREEQQQQQQGDENAPPTARGGVADKPADADASKGRVHDRSSAASSAARRRAGSVATTDVVNQLEANLTGVIYAPLGSKTYLAGGFRSRSQRAPVASPRLGAPRRVSDPVRRYQQMKEYWDHDHFLRMQQPDGQRRKLRWAVRSSMNEWHPEGAYPVVHHSLAY
eukprot:CAMPEP_0174843958 /NCGR_PEP_ID=MMETSP1114-20130205/10833_1 /TAXON_ID=312471 /ORGANISM="Neobodo designis, Strain CCAP 1951/1" /LENGTH=481 /DNA_ID=CAMNT_0016078191 /DNA_START=30 /DNA_END=1475 /DNA_ORIENTATION=-